MMFVRDRESKHHPTQILTAEVMSDTSNRDHNTRSHQRGRKLMISTLRRYVNLIDLI